MMSHNKFVLGMTLAVIALVLVTVAESSFTRRDFTRACDKEGGETVWDGRQYQCLNKQAARTPQ